jgi:mannonate dehydratase
MRIEDVEVIVSGPVRGGPNWTIVKIVTDVPGLVGYGNGALSGGEPVVAAMVEQLKPRLIGADPDRIEDTWQMFHRSTYWRAGRVLAGAMAAIDVALWDIKGKRAGLPLNSLLGGKCRDKVLCYGHASGQTIDDTIAAVRAYRERGYRAIRAQVATPGYEGGSYGAGGGGAAVPDEPPARRVRRWEPTPYLRVVPHLFERLRAEVGPNVELLHDVHDRLTPVQVAQLAKELEPYHLFFLEDPIPIENKDGLRLLRAHTTTPIAIGERYSSKWDCLPAITGQLIDYVRNAMSKSGGLTELRKIATIAEPFQVKTAFQCPTDVGPLAFAATVHLDLAIPNFGIQEDPHFSAEAHELFPGLPAFADGYYTVSDKPGLGVDVDEAGLKRHPYRPFFFPVIRRDDGSLQDP